MAEVCSTLAVAGINTSMSWVGSYEAAPTSCVTFISKELTYYDAYGECEALVQFVWSTLLHFCVMFFSLTFTLCDTIDHALVTDPAKFEARLVWILNEEMATLTLSIQTVVELTNYGTNNRLL